MSARVTAEPMKPPAPVTRTRSPEDNSMTVAPKESVGSVRGAPKRVLGHGPAELEEEARSPGGGGEDVVEGVDEVFDLLVTGDEGGQELDHVHVVRRHLGEDAVAVEERHHHEL